MEIVAEYLGSDVSYRDLELRYGISASTLHRWVREYKNGKLPEKEAIERVAAGLASGG